MFDQKCECPVRMDRSISVDMQRKEELRSLFEEVVIYDARYCKKILWYCDHYLNNYIKFLIPPQESCCEHFRKFLASYDNKARWSTESNLRVTSDSDAEKAIFLTPNETYQFAEEEPSPAYEKEVDLDDKPVFVNALTPSKVCRFAGVTDVVPIVDDENQDEVDSVIYIPEPFRTHSISSKSSKFSLSSPREAPESKQEVIFLPDPTQVEVPEEKFSSTPIVRPKYTTQVSTISQRSNVVSLYSCWPPPIGIIIISLVEIILFFLNEKKPITERYTHGEIADTLMYDPFRRKEFWRFITYLLVHIGYQHLLFNLAVQVFLGIILEMVHQRWRVLTIYFAGILAASLGTSVFNPRAKLAGASGGVYSLITAHIVTVILKWKHMQYPATQLLVFLIVIITDFATGIQSSYQNKIVDISYTAHACGALAGLLVGFPVLRKLSNKKRTRCVQCIGLVIYLVLILIAVIWNIVATDYFPTQEV